MLYQRITSTNHSPLKATHHFIQMFYSSAFFFLPPPRENLLKFPHLAAIQHNNCMYLAHHLLTLGHYFRAHLPQPLNEGVATFVDMVPGFRKLGKQQDTALSFKKKQVTALINLFESSKL